MLFDKTEVLRIKDWDQFQKVLKLLVVIMDGHKLNTNKGVHHGTEITYKSIC